MGSHRVEHDWSNLAAAAAAVVKYKLSYCVLTFSVAFEERNSYIMVLPSEKSLKELKKNVWDILDLPGEMCSS